MDFAIDVTSKQLVSASDASKYRYYRCPVCGSSTVLRLGRIKSPHFAHRKNTADPRCKEYHPSPYELAHHRGRQAVDVGTEQSEITIEPTQLCIAVRLESRTLPKWELRIQLPHSPDGIGRMSYNLGDFKPRDIHMRTLSKGNVSRRDFPANPAGTRFHARWVSPETNVVFRDAVSEEMPGLQQEGFTPFQCTDKRLKPRAQQLQWGNCYYVVWKHDLHLDFPKSLAPHLFAQNQGYSCALVDLPDFPDLKTEEWLRSNCSCDFESRRNRMSVLYPFLTHPNASGGTDVPMKQGFLLGIAEQIGESSVPLSEDKRTELIEVSPNSQTVLEFRSEHEGRPAHIHLGGSFARNFRLCPHGDSAGYGKLPAVEIEIVEAGGKSLRFDLHTSSSRKWLEQVRNGRAQLTGVAFPSYALGKISLRDSIDRSWREVQRISSPNRGRRPTNSLEKLGSEEVVQLEAFVKLPCDVKVSFDSFGELEFLSKSDEGKSDYDLPKELRDRILWLCAESSHTYNIPGNAAKRTTSDQDPLGMFWSATPPVNLEPHYRSVARRLKSASA